MTQAVYEELLALMKSRRGPYAGLDIPEFFALVKDRCFAAPKRPS